MTTQVFNGTPTQLTSSEQNQKRDTVTELELHSLFRSPTKKAAKGKDTTYATKAAVKTVRTMTGLRSQRRKTRNNSRAPRGLEGTP